MRRPLMLALALLALSAAVPAVAAADSDPIPGAAQGPVLPAPVSSASVRPGGFRISPAQAVKVAETSPAALAIHRVHHPLQYEVKVWPASHYEVLFSFQGRTLADVFVERSGRLGPTYTGALITADYARGHYGGVFDSPWVLVPFTALFLAPLLLTRRAGLAQLDLVAVLGFGVSYWLFDHRHLEAGVWSAYVPLLYLGARMLMRGRRGPGPGRRPPLTTLPTAVLLIGLVALLAARIGLTLDPHRVIDVATASALGAYKILHGQSLYYGSTAHLDTYGPVAYLAYVPFEWLWPGNWGSLPAARAAVIGFDLMTVAGLLLLGWRSGGRGRNGLRAGLLMGWLWAACPFTLLGMVKGTNDGLLALLAVALMLTVTMPARRGIVLGLATAAKFFPVVLLALMLRGPDSPLHSSHVRRVLAGFIVAAGVAIAVFLPSGGIKELYDHTLGFQLSRPDVFSAWALHPGLVPVKLLLEIAVGGLALLCAVRPAGPRSLAQVGALAGALTIAVQLPAVHWFYFYIVWFLPFVLIAVVCEATGTGSEARADPGPAMQTVGVVTFPPERVLAGVGAS